MRINTEITLNPTEIVFLQSMANYTWVHTFDKKYISSRTLKVLATRIEADYFLKTKRGILININHITYFNCDEDDAFVTLSNGKKLPISRRQFSMVKKALE